MLTEEHDPKAALIQRAQSILALPAAAYRTKEAAMELLPDVVALLENLPPASKAASAKIKELTGANAELVNAIDMLRADLADANARLKAANETIAFFEAATQPPKDPVDPARDLGLK